MRMRMWRLTYGEVNVPVKLNQWGFFPLFIYYNKHLQVFRFAGRCLNTAMSVEMSRYKRLRSLSCNEKEERR